MAPKPGAQAGSRFLGIDDAPFTFDDRDCLVVGVVTRGAGLVEGMLTTRVAVDGRDATETLEAAVRASRHAANLSTILLDGLTLGGFNVVDGATLSEATALPVVALTRREPDPEAARKAMEGHLPDWQERWRVFSARPPQPFHLASGTLWGAAWGIHDNEVPGLLAAATLEGNWPECLRLAHMIGQAVVQGESRNKA